MVSLLMCLSVLTTQTASILCINMQLFCSENVSLFFNVHLLTGTCADLLCAACDKHISALPVQ